MGMSRTCDMRDKDGIKCMWGERYQMSMSLSLQSLVIDIFYMLDGIDDLVDELECHSRDDTFSVGERSLQRAERDPCFLRRNTREELKEESQICS